jgi:hypothetical protein
VSRPRVTQRAHRPSQNIAGGVKGELDKLAGRMANVSGVVSGTTSTVKSVEAGKAK